MAVSKLVMEVSGPVLTGIKEISLNESMSQRTAMAEIICTGVAVIVGSTISSITIGRSGDSSIVLKDGIVKKIIQRQPQHDYVVTVYDRLVLAQDFFIAPDDPENPYRATNITAEDLVVYLLGLAGITGVTTTATGFTFGTVTPVPIKLVSAGDYIENINRITGFLCWADPVTGVISFTTRKPYLVGGDTSSYDIEGGNGGNILTMEYEASDEKLRNRVVVYGAPNVKATASASSVYLPANFYKTIVVAHEMIDRQLEADAAATFNLEQFNRLTETVKVKIRGKSSVHARSIVTFTESFSGLAALFIVFAAKHTINRSGYVTELTLVR